MAEGRVKWFNGEKGYGFITPADLGPDVFLHFSEIDLPGYKTFDQGQAVSFEIEQGTHGPMAKQVRPIAGVDIPPLEDQVAKPVSEPRPQAVRREGPYELTHPDSEGLRALARDVATHLSMRGVSPQRYPQADHHVVETRVLGFKRQRKVPYLPAEVLNYWLVGEILEDGYFYINRDAALGSNRGSQGACVLLRVDGQLFRAEYSRSEYEYFSPHKKGESFELSGVRECTDDDLCILDEPNTAGWRQCRPGNNESYREEVERAFQVTVAARGDALQAALMRMQR